MFDHLLESSHQHDSNKCPNIEFGEEIIEVESFEVHFKHLIWSSENKILTLNKFTIIANRVVFR